MTHAPTTRRSAVEQAHLDAALTTLFEQQISFNQVLGLKFTGHGPNGPTLRFDMRPDLVGHHLYGRLHGGVISATLDAMGGLAVMWAIAEKHADEATALVMQRFAKLGTIDLRVDFLRPGVGERFSMRAEVLRLGSRVASTRMEFFDEAGKLLSTGAAAYIVS